MAAMVARVDVRDADDWWGTLPDAQRVSYWRWLSKTPAPPPTDGMEPLFGDDDPEDGDEGKT